MVDFEAIDTIDLDRMIVALDFHGALAVCFCQVADLVEGRFRVEALAPLGISCNWSATLNIIADGHVLYAHCRIDIAGDHRSAVWPIPKGLAGSVRPDRD